jgi:hypothetical protein
MSFSGKSTFTAGATLPELLEDVADIVSIVTPFETPLLAYLGDPKRSATSTIHEWMEDTLLPNTDAVNQSSFSPDAATATVITVDSGARFQAGDLARPGDAREVMQVASVSGNNVTFVRQYGGTPASDLADNLKLTILGNAALEGAAALAARFTSRSRKLNYTQIFTASVDVSGTMQATRLHAVSDELDYQKQERLRELLRDLENCVINGTAPAANPQGSTTVRRSMNGIIRQISTNQFIPGEGVIPVGGGDENNSLTEDVLNAALRTIWENSSARVDTIVAGGLQKRRINKFIASTVREHPAGGARFSDGVSVYESDFGVCNVLLSRWVPADTILLLDSSRIEVVPLAGRSFHFKPLAATGDSSSGQLIGEYTLEFRNENAHGLLRGLSTEIE